MARIPDDEITRLKTEVSSNYKLQINGARSFHATLIKKPAKNLAGFFV
jgi:hypothetical protein